MPEMWILWACLGGFVVFYALRPLQDTTNMFAPPLIVALLTFGILVKSYFDFDDLSKAVLLNVDAYIMTLAYAVLCMIVLCLAYEAGVRRPSDSKSSTEVDELSRTVVTGYVILIGLIGFGAQYLIVGSAGGFAEAYSQAHGAGMGYENQSNYLNALPNFMWPALLIGYATMARKGRSPILLAATVVIGAALFAHTFLFGNRNGIIRFCIILGGAYAFIHRPSLKKSLPLIGMLLFGALTVDIIGRIRGDLHLGSDVSLVDAISNYFTEQKERGGYKYINWEAGGHEFFFNVAVVQSAWQMGTYDYGAQYIFPFINFIPRAWWPDKPIEFQFVVDYFELSRSVTGWDPGAGAAPSCVGLSFLAFSWLGCIPWGIFGYVCGRIVRAARDEASLMNLGWLISCLLGSIYWGTQGFSSVFFAVFFTIMPFYGLRVLAAFRRSSAPQHGLPKRGLGATS